MRFQNYTTPMLEQLKADFEYTAQMSALEKIETDPASAEEYAELTDELARREEMYRQHSTREGFAKALEDCLLPIGQRLVASLITELGQGRESTERPDEVRLNPRNPFFRDVVLQVDEDQGSDGLVRRAVFVPGNTIPFEWVQAEVADLPASFQAENGRRRYDVLRLLSDRSGRIEFVSQIDESSGEERVTGIVVWCW